MPTGPAPTRAVERIKRRVYLVALPTGAVAATAVWLLERAADVLHVVDRYGIPLLVGLCVWQTLAIVRGARNLRTLELILFVSFSAFMLASLSFTLFGDHPVNANVGDLAGAGYWFPVVYGLAFLQFGTPLGLHLSLGLFATSLLLGAIHLVTGDPERIQQESLIISQIYTANGLVLLMFASVAAITRLQARYAVTLERAAFSDGLTGLSNRRHLETLVGEEIERAVRYGRSFSLILLDIDHFKAINDRHGHDVGDEVLRAIATTLRAHVRQVDEVARWGGEEFLVLAPEMGLADAKGLAERLRRVFDGGLQIGDVAVTASFGVTEYTHGDTVATLYRRADEALYAAKRSGRNAVVAVATD